MADDESPEVVYEKQKMVRAGILVRYKFIYPAAIGRYPPGACYALHYGIANPANPPDDVEWPIGPKQVRCYATTTTTATEPIISTSQSSSVDCF
ncbi:hypothetical protein MUK72_18975 (plasmid) [Halococcus dombrowskii]|uniref:Uncharacterized protein n=1 Tax=Halococcus dombrowskii TaxID=179637 RepID=A0AAV3SJX5_HALDO|nr:hypothetical protein [Halococcus dombrowskii]UOO97241.1 hypothetical protein MUK72_18975 [Halococcus dombrowskii]